MIVPPTNVRVFVATNPVDFRKGVDGRQATYASHAIKPVVLAGKFTAAHY